MSEASKEAVSTTIEHLKRAERNLQNASDAAKETGDKSLVKQVEKIKTDTTTTRTDTERKMEPQGS